MSLKTKVKVGKITNLSDARYCAGMGVDFLGFQIGTTHGIDPRKYKEITEWVAGPRFVLEWQGSDIEIFEKAIQDYNADFIELSVMQLDLMTKFDMPVFLSLTPSEWASNKASMLNYKLRISHLLIKSYSHTTPVQLIAEMKSEFPVLVNVAESKVTLEELLKLPIDGISLEGSEESKPGLKDYSHLSDILESLESME